jgi:hypothetical protein
MFTFTYVLYGAMDLQTVSFFVQEMYKEQVVNLRFIT